MNKSVFKQLGKVSPLNPDAVKEPGMEGAEQHVVSVRERALNNVIETPKQACDDVME